MIDVDLLAEYNQENYQNLKVKMNTRPICRDLEMAKQWPLGNQQKEKENVQERGI